MLIGTFYHVAATSFAAYNNLKFCNETVHMYKLVYFFFFFENCTAGEAPTVVFLLIKINNDKNCTKHGDDTNPRE